MKKSLHIIVFILFLIDVKSNQIYRITTSRPYNPSTSSSTSSIITTSSSNSTTTSIIFSVIFLFYNESKTCTIKNNIKYHYIFCLVVDYSCFLTPPLAREINISTRQRKVKIIKAIFILFKKFGN